MILEGAEDGNFLTPVLRRGSGFTESDPGFGEIVGGHFDRHTITGHDANEVFPHLAGYVGKDDVPVGHLHPKHGSRQDLHDDTFSSYRFVSHWDG